MKMNFKFSSQAVGAIMLALQKGIMEQVDITGLLKEFEIVKSFIELLKSNEEFSKDFSSIQFLKSERTRVRGQENMIFKVEAKVKSKSKRSKAKRKGRRKWRETSY